MKAKKLFFKHDNLCKNNNLLNLFKLMNVYINLAALDLVIELIGLCPNSYGIIKNLKTKLYF